MPSLHDMICNAGVSTLAEFLCTPCTGDGGDCTEIGIPIDIIVEDIPIDINETDPIIIALEPQTIELDISDPIIGIDIIQEDIEIEIKDC